MVIGWLFVAAGVLMALGYVSGYMLAIRSLPRMIARMTPAEVDALAERVAELKGLRDGPS